MPRLTLALALSLTFIVDKPVWAIEGALPAPASLAVELQALVDQAKLPGAIAVLERDGARIDSAVVGWQNVEAEVELREDSVFRLFSMSKPITSVAIMMLVEQGRLSLEAPALKYLPEFEDMHVHVAGGLDDLVTEPVQSPISIRQLLTHNSGIVYPFTGDSTVHRYYRKYGVMRETPVGRTPDDGVPASTLDQLVQRIGDAPLLHQPGSGFHYSYSTTVLGAVIERVTGVRLSTALRTMLFDPLEMGDTRFVICNDQLPRFTTLYEAVPSGIEPIEYPEDSDYRDPSRLLDGGGGLVSTAGDYLRFARMLANGGEFAGRRYLSEASVEDMFRAQTQIHGADSRSVGLGYGFALGDESSEEQGTQPAGTLGWSGSGNTFFFINPANGLIGLFMTHELTPREHVSRGTAFRRIMTQAASGDPAQASD